MTNKIIQFSEQKLIDKNRCKWSFGRPYDAIDHILFYLFRLQSCTFIATVLFVYLGKIAISKLSSYRGLSKLPLPVSDMYFFLFIKRNQQKLAC